MFAATFLSRSLVGTADDFTAGMSIRVLFKDVSHVTRFFVLSHRGRERCVTRLKECIKTETSRHCLRFLMRQKHQQKSPCCPMWGNTDSRIRESLAWRILNKEILACGIRNPGLWNTEYSSRNPQSHLRLESEIQDPLTMQLVSSTSNPESTAWNPESKTVMDFLGSRSESYQCELILGTSKQATRVDICQIHEILSGKQCSL